MALSSEDVVNWELKTGMRGYLVPQVDELLDEVADELDRLGLRIRELEAEREAVRSSLDEQFEVEETLRRTLYQAQKAADQTLADAAAEAERLRTEAADEAEKIRASAREGAEQIVEDARHQANEDRAEIRSRLEAQETRLRATGSQLRRDLVTLHGLAQETRGLLRGLHEDRLRQLDQGMVALPEFDEALWSAQGFDDEAPDDESPEVEAGSSPEPGQAIADDAVSDDASGDDVSTDDASTDDGSTDGATDGNVSADDATAVVADTSVATSAHDDSDDGIVDKGADDAAVDPPPYLAAVSEAIATIEENQNKDEQIVAPVVDDEPSPDDLLDSVLADDPGIAHHDLAQAVAAKPDDLFGDRPPPRRRRST